MLGRNREAREKLHSITSLLESARPRRSALTGGMLAAMRSHNRLDNEWTLSLPEIGSSELVLEVGFGPGDAIRLAGAPVVVAPPPAPAAIVVTPGWHGDRYWDGHRYWERDDREKQHHHVKGWHCPPGHASKGEC